MAFERSEWGPERQRHRMRCPTQTHKCEEKKYIYNSFTLIFFYVHSFSVCGLWQVTIDHHSPLTLQRSVIPSTTALLMPMLCGKTQIHFPCQPSIYFICFECSITRQLSYSWTDRLYTQHIMVGLEIKWNQIKSKRTKHNRMCVCVCVSFIQDFVGRTSEKENVWVQVCVCVCMRVRQQERDSKKKNKDQHQQKKAQAKTIANKFKEYK